MILFFQKILIIGKSTFLSRLFLELEHHFSVPKNEKIEHIFYFYRELDDNVISLKRAFKEQRSTIDFKFSTYIADDFVDTLPRNSIVCFDDMQELFEKSKELQRQLWALSSILCHHRQCYAFFISQSVQILRKNHKLNCIISQLSYVVLFRNILEGKSLRRFLNNLTIKMKSNMSLSDVYDKFIQNKKHSYLLICVSPRANKCTAFSNILLSEPGNMLSFHYQSDNENSDYE